MIPVVAETIEAGFSPLEAIEVAIRVGPSGFGIGCWDEDLSADERFLGAAFETFVAGGVRAIELVEALDQLFTALGRRPGVAIDRASSAYNADVIIAARGSEDDPGLFAVISLDDAGDWVVSEPDGLPLSMVMAIGGDL